MYQVLKKTFVASFLLGTLTTSVWGDDSVCFKMAKSFQDYLESSITVDVQEIPGGMNYCSKHKESVLLQTKSNGHITYSRNNNDLHMRHGPYSVVICSDERAFVKNETTGEVLCSTLK